ncbi:MAG: 30S ribosomal protein S4 [Candidatus Woesearchaeota archaeon]
MGSPKKQRKKFSKPSHPWQKERILAEKELLKEYGLKRKYEIWKMSSILKNFTSQAKNLITIKNPQVEKERKQLLTKLSSLGLVGKSAKIEDVLSLTLKDIMERRLQTLVYRKHMANNIKQARQFIVHAHISLGDKKITVPSYIVLLDEEASIQFSQGSVLANSEHPSRVKEDKKKPKKKEESNKKEEKEGTKEKPKEKEAVNKLGDKETKPEKKKTPKEEKVPSTHDLKKRKEKKDTKKESEAKKE